MKEDFVTTMDEVADLELNDKPQFFNYLLERCVPLELRQELNKDIPSEFWKRIGKKIHIKSRWGTYVLKRVCPNGMILTCKTWQHTNHKERLYPFSDFHCIVGQSPNKAPKLK